jgi:3-dehydroquinate synthase
MEDIQLFNFNIKSSVHDYRVTFVEDFSSSLKEQLKEGDVIIIDGKVKSLYRDRLEDSLARQRHIVIEANEEQKSYLGVVPVIENLIENGFRKNHHLVAIGGGITQDVTAFTASIMYRGVKWIFFPTTLLAQGDSCIGSKTSINFGKYKNQVGGFYPPHHIFIDLVFLDTLADLEIKSGLGEMCHYFVVAGEDDFKRFKQEYSLARKDKNILAGIIARSLEIKKRYIEIDEFDQNQRQVFNYGHSFGHALETLTDYRVPHGIAVAYGMDMANFISVKLKLIPEQVRFYIRELLEEIWKDVPIDEISLDKFITALKRDKKNVGSELRLILNQGIGNIFKTGMKPDEQFCSWLEEYFKTQL